MSETPETDDIARGNHVVPTEWAQQLERERNEALAGRQAYKQLAVKHAQERDDAREKYATEATEHMLAINKLCNERDEAREEANKLSGAYEDATNYYARIIELKEELDEAREALVKILKNE